MPTSQNVYEVYVTYVVFWDDVATQNINIDPTELC